jgi:hypothetical protein
MAHDPDHPWSGRIRDGNRALLTRRLLCLPCMVPAVRGSLFNWVWNFSAVLLSRYRRRFKRIMPLYGGRAGQRADRLQSRFARV